MRSLSRYLFFALWSPTCILMSSLAASWNLLDSAQKAAYIAGGVLMASTLVTKLVDWRNTRTTVKATVDVQREQILYQRIEALELRIDKKDYEVAGLHDENARLRDLCEASEKKIHQLKTLITARGLAVELAAGNV